MHRYRVIVPDWIGWGLSDHPDRFVLFADYVEALRALLHTLDQPALVVAQGLSGGFAAALAKEEPGLFARLILWSATGGKDFGEDSFKPLARAIATPIAKQPTLNVWFYRLAFHRPSTIRAWFTRRGFYNPHAVSDAIVDGSLYSARQPRAAYSALPFLSGDLRFDIVPYLDGLSVPAFMVWGEAETQITPQIRRKLAAVNGQIRQITLPRAGSNPELELPGQAVALLEQLMTGVPPT